MAQEYGFFNSTSYTQEGDIVVGNKAKDASFFARYFSSFVTNGVFSLNSFVPTIGSGLTLNISAGQCWINGYFAYDDSTQAKTFTAGKEYWFVQRLDTANGELNAVWVENPTSGELPSRTASVYDLVLFKVNVPAGATSLTASMVTDCRADEDLCGLVTGINDGLVSESGVITPEWAASVELLSGGSYSASSVTPAAQSAKAATVSDSTFSYRAGVLVALSSGGNTAANPTLNINSLGAVPVVSMGSASIDKCWPNGTVLMVYNGTSFVLLNSEAGYVPLSGGQLTGKLKAHPNADYTEYQVRNIAFGTSASLPTGYGSILGVYE